MITPTGPFDPFVPYEPFPGEPEFDGIADEEFFLSLPAYTPFLHIPSYAIKQGTNRPAWVVEETRATIKGIMRRVIGAFGAKSDAESAATAAKSALRRYIESHDGYYIRAENCGGTMLDYYEIDNPPSVVGFAVSVHETRFADTFP